MSLEHLGFKIETNGARKKSQIPEAMEEIEERKASTEQIWPEGTDSSRHKVVAGGGGEGAAVVEVVVRVGNNPSHRTT